MTTYNTGNPVPSTAVRDLFDNAENLDTAVNDRALDYWFDRLGIKRLTWEGMTRLSNLGAAVAAAELAEAFALEAQAAADMAALSSGLYPDIDTAINGNPGEGWPAVPDGHFFTIRSPQEFGFLDLYQVVGSGASYQATYPSKEALDEVLGLIMPDGNDDLALSVTDGEGGMFFRATPTEDELFIGDGEGGIMLRVAPEQSVLGPLEVRYTPNNGVYVTDGNGGIFQRLDEVPESSAEPDPDPEPVPSILERGALFAPTIAITEDSPANINVPAMLYDRMAYQSVTATVAATSTPAQVSDSYTLRVDSSFGSAANLFLKPVSGEPPILRMPLNIINVPTPAVSPIPFNILLIGDSISNLQGARFLKENLESWGYAPNFVGTINGVYEGTYLDDGGPLGEARSSWRLMELTNFAPDPGKPPVAIGEEAAYLSGDKAYKHARNPFLRPATGEDDPSIVLNGYVMDFEFYATRFSVPTPHLIFHGLGTNDRGANAPGIPTEDLPAYRQQLISDLDTLVYQQIFAAWPSARVIRTHPQPCRIPSSEEGWQVGHVPVIKGAIEGAKPFGNVLVAPGWALYDGVDYEFTAEGVDPITGFESGDITDGTHPHNSARRAYYRALSAYVAAVHLGLA